MGSRPDLPPRGRVWLCDTEVVGAVIIFVFWPPLLTRLEQHMVITWHALIGMS